MSFKELALEPKQASILAFGLALVGLLLIYVWPTEQAYQNISLASLPILQDGQWVQVIGVVDLSTSKPSGYSLRFCQDSGGCGTISVGSAQARAFSTDGAAPGKGTRLRVWGEVAVLQQNRFIRAHKIAEG